MPMYDFQCEKGHTFEKFCRKCVELEICEQCEKECRDEGGCRCIHTAKRVLLPSRRSVIGDEIDVSIAHGLCNSDGTPRRFRSREELKRAEAKAGLTNYVTHVGEKGSDKSKHTSKWY